MAIKPKAISDKKTANKKKRKKILKFSLLIFLLVLSVIPYLLADRYLIEHVELVVESSNIPDETSAVSVGNVEYDDWHYKSDNIEISIEKVQTGSGDDMITYFVADVKLKSTANLLSAFAKNSYGRNIVETTSKIASDNGAILAINGDYYGFRKDGVLIRNGVLFRDVPARDGAVIYRDGTMETYDETEVSASELLAKGALHTLSFGPILVKNGVAIDFSGKVAIDTNFGNRSIQNANPRTGIGIISPNHFVFVVVDGRSENYSRGMTLNEFADLFVELGCTEAYNLDGGGSSTMYFMGRVVNNPRGKEKERAISDILYIAEQ